MIGERRRVLSVTIADCEVQTKRGSGAGGQNRNKRDTAVRIVHPPSGAVGESEEERSQLQNKHTAFRRMVESVKFKTWLARQLSGGPTPEEKVAEDMHPDNLLIEVRRAGLWTSARARPGQDAQ